MRSAARHDRSVVSGGGFVTDAQFVAQVGGWDRPPNHPDSSRLCAELLDRYRHVAAPLRSALRNAVHRGPTMLACLDAHVEAIRQQLSPDLALQAGLTAIALTRGGPGDWRDVIVRLTALWSMSARAGIDPRPHFLSAAAIADDGNQHGVSGLSTRALIEHAVRLVDLGQARLPLEPPTDEALPPCPACDRPLRSPTARQCFECGADWHSGPPPATSPNSTRPFTPDPNATAHHISDPNTTDAYRSAPATSDTGDASPQTTASHEPATTGGRYRLGAELARGGMGVVYRAIDTAFWREVAVKVVGPALAGSEAERRFVAEARITGRLQHPSVPPVHDLSALADGRPFIAMKLIQGRTLADDFRASRAPNGELSAEDRDRLIRAFEQVCLAVAFAHSRGVIHRDLKPQNIMVGAFGEVQVMDWGLAKVLTDPVVDSPAPIATADNWPTGPDERTAAGRVLGTPSYMPPEQARGEADTADERADVFALGGILCTLLTGMPPYTGASAREVWGKAVQADLADAFQRLDAVKGAGRLVDLARRCLQPEPARRPAHAGEVAVGVRSALDWAERIKRGEELTLATHVASYESGVAARRSGGLVLLAVAAVALAGIVVWWGETRLDTQAWEHMPDLTASVARAIDQRRLTGEANAPYRDKLVRRLESTARRLDSPWAADPWLLLYALHTAEKKPDLAATAWQTAINAYASPAAPEHREGMLALHAVLEFGREESIGEFERLIVLKAATVLDEPDRLPPGMANSDALTVARKRVEAVKGKP